MHSFHQGPPLSIYLAHVVKSSTVYDKHFHTRDCTAQYLRYDGLFDNYQCTELTLACTDI